MTRTPDSLPPALLDDLTLLLQTHRFGRTAEFHAALDSTNRRVLEWGRIGAPDGALVVADHQTAGRGRFGRQWVDEPGQNLLFSVLIRANGPHEGLGLIGLAAAVAVAETLAPLTSPLRPTLKWPNDVLLAGRKTCGILPEALVTAGAAEIALGIGLNVNQGEFPGEVAGRATSLMLATGRPVERAPLLAEMLAQLEEWTDRALSDGRSKVVAAFTERMAVGTEISVSASGRIVSGTVHGIADDGALELRVGDEIRRYHAGEATSRAKRSTEPPGP